MYEMMLLCHSWLRWLLFCSLCFVFLRSLFALKRHETYQAKDKVARIVLVATAHLQFVIGFVLYFVVSPITRSAMENFGPSMHSPVLRYWLVEHVSIMVLVVVCIQIGSSWVKRAADTAKKHKVMAYASGLALLLVIIGMPWPKREFGRPLFNYMDLNNKELDKKISDSRFQCFNNVSKNANKVTNLIIHKVATTMGGKVANKNLNETYINSSNITKSL